MLKLKRRQDRRVLDRAAFSATTTPSYQEPNYYRPRSEDRDQMLEGLAIMLWARLRTNTDDVQAIGLPLALWQSIRDEDYSNELMVALKSVIRELTDPTRLPPALQLFMIKSLFFENLDSQPRLREWRDIVWGIKTAGKGVPTPHALDDIFWKKIKRARQLADAGKRQGLRDNIFQKKTTIFKGVQVDEYGHLQPKNSLAEILVRAARLYKKMIIYPDQKLMEQYLFNYPPLHPRRTLDQAYFWRLRDTRLRDRDQVVYRYTTLNLPTNAGYSLLLMSRMTDQEFLREEQNSHPMNTVMATGYGLAMGNTSKNMDATSVKIISVKLRELSWWISSECGFWTRTLS